MKKIAFLSLSLLLAVSLLGGCGTVPPHDTAAIPPVSAEPQPESAAEAPAEYAPDDPSLLTGFVCEDNARVFYEIFVGSFSDSDGDGIGDLRGIRNRLDYLNDGDPGSGYSLGIEVIWLTPVFPSPSYHKYDVADYYGIDPKFGTTADFQELCQECHARNVKLILDLPINHTSTRNEWFQQFIVAHRSGDTSSPYYDFYSWCSADSPVPGSTFRPIPDTDHLYECNFSDDMPELNFDNEAVRQELVKVARYWIDLGADGFRFDAAKYIYFNDNSRSSGFWLWDLDELRSYRPDLYTVAEVWDADSVTDLYYSSTNCFDFSLSQAEGLYAATAKGGDPDKLAAYTEDYLDRVHGIEPSAMLVPFLTNHDQDRAAGFLSVSEGKMQMAANLYLLGPGSPFIYYGEELGMKGSRGAANTDANRRLAMVWGDGDTVKDPEGSTYKKQIENGAAAQLPDKGSLYNHYKLLLMIRHANPEIARGVYQALDIPGGSLGGFTALWRGSTVCVLHNTSPDTVTVDLATLGLPFSELRAAAGQGEAFLDGSILSIGPLTSAVLK